MKNIISIVTFGRIILGAAPPCHLPFIFRNVLMPMVLICAQIGLNFNSAWAQVVVKRWDKSFAQDFPEAMSGSHTLRDAVQTADGGFLLAGSYSKPSGYEPLSKITRGDNLGRSYYWIVKTDDQGNKQWDKSYGGSGEEGLSTVVKATDGGYLLAGSSTSGISGDRSQSSRGGWDYWVVKVTRTGVKQWDKRFGGSGDDYIASVVPTSDGGYLLAGSSSSSISGDKSEASRGRRDYWVVKVNIKGIKQWDKRFGSSGDDYLTSVIQTVDGGFLLGGFSSGIRGDRSQPSRGLLDYWVVKVDSRGTKLWDKRFGGSSNDRLKSLIPTADGGYLLAGTSVSDISGDKSQASRGSADSDYWVVKVDSRGNKLWDKTIGGSRNDDLASIIPTAYGGYLLAGTSVSGIGGDKAQESRGFQDYWIVKVNRNGTKEWDRRFGGAAQDQIYSVIPIVSDFVSKSGYLLAGSSSSAISGDKTQPRRSNNDYWIVNVGIEPILQMGNSNLSTALENEITTEGGFAMDLEKTQEAVPFSIKASPNPFSDKIAITFTSDQTGMVNLQVYDVKGSSVAHLYTGEVTAGRTYSYELAAGALPSGLYVARLNSTNKVSQIKLILAR